MSPNRAVTAIVRATSVLVVALLLSSPTAADVVLLKNGKSFEGVETDVGDTHVRIQLPIGSLSLPLSQVDRIEETQTVLGEFRTREAALRAQEETSAESWLELALWAQRNDYERGTRSAATRAARLDPALERLEPLMRSLGFVREAGVWMDFADAMRLRGLVQDRGEWITPEERRARMQERAETAERDALARRDDQIDKALDIIAEQVDKEEPASTTTVVVSSFPGFVGGGFGFFPGVIGGTLPFAPGSGPTEIRSPRAGSLSGLFFKGDAKVTSDTTFDQLVLRQPGSLIPASPRFFR